MNQGKIDTTANGLFDTIEGQRCTQRYTQKALCEKAGIPPTIYSDLKHGARKLTLNLALRLLDALDLKLEVVSK